MGAAPRFPERARDLTPDEQALELIQEWRFTRLRWMHTNEHDVADRARALRMLDALMDEYNDRILPQVVLTESHLHLGEE